MILRHLVKRCHPNSGMYYLSVLSPKKLSEIPQQSLDLPFFNPKYKLRGSSCRGLLNFFNFRGNVFLCNPATKQFKFLPHSKEPLESVSFREKRVDLHYITAAGFGYDSISDGYKILRVNRKPTTDLYLLRSDCWKEIPSPDVDSDGVLPESVYVGDMCYWISGRTEILSFDFSEERFSSLVLPCMEFATSSELVTVNLNGDNLLGVICYDGDGGPKKKLWVLRGEEWEGVFDVSLCSGVGPPMSVINGRFMIFNGFSRKSGFDYRLLAYDWIRKECEELGIYDVKPMKVFSYVESTVSLPDGKPIAGSQILNDDYLADEYEDSLDAPAKYDDATHMKKKRDGGSDGGGFLTTDDQRDGGYGGDGGDGCGGYSGGGDGGDGGGGCGGGGCGGGD